MTSAPLRSWMRDRAEGSWMVAGVAPGMLNSMRLSPVSQFDSVIAARNVQRPRESAQTPSPLFVSGVSEVVLTTMVALATAAALVALVELAVVERALIDLGARPAAIVSPVRVIGA